MKDETPVSGSKEPKLGAKGQLRKAKVLSVAGSILINEGIDNLILRKVATEADIKLGHLQYYFPTRDDLLEALINETWETDEAALVSASTPEEILQVVKGLLVAWGGDRGKIYLVLTLRSLYDERFRLLKQKIYQSFYEDLMLFLKPLHPERSKQELLRQAKMITSLMDGAMLQDHSGSERVMKKQKSDFQSDLSEMVLKLMLS
jgi:AcrR family transcriptional regulator